MNRRFMDVFVLAGAFLLAGLLAFQLPGCGGGDGGGVVSTPTGTLQVGLTDKNSDNYQNVVVAIKEIRVVPAGKENAPDDDPGLPIIATFDPPYYTVDILTLRFVQDLLGTAVIPAGSYNQVRLILAPNPPGSGAELRNYLTLKTDPETKIPLTTPSGQQSGLKVLGKFTVRAGAINAILIDFDPNTAIVVRSNGDYNLKPTGIRIVQLSSPLYDDFGTISGTVLSTFKAFSSATVSVFPEGSPSPVAAGTVFSTYSSGRWEAPFTSFVPSGAYRVHVEAKGFQLYTSALLDVFADQETPLGNLELVPLP